MIQWSYNSVASNHRLFPLQYGAAEVTHCIVDGGVMPGPNLSGFDVIVKKLAPVVRAGHAAAVDVAGTLPNPIHRSISSVGTVSQFLEAGSPLREFASGLKTPFWAQPSFHSDVVEHGPIAALKIRNITPAMAADVVNVLSNVGPLAAIPAVRGLTGPAVAAGSTGAGSFVGATLADDDVAARGGGVGGPPLTADGKPMSWFSSGGYGGTAGKAKCDEVFERYLAGGLSYEDAVKACPAIKTFLEM